MGAWPKSIRFALRFPMPISTTCGRVSRARGGQSPNASAIGARACVAWCEDAYNITHWTTMPRGGHFAAFEQPELFVEDVRAFFDTVR
jgi:pimeloyl-ACP methyl ester carboxylesterase